LDKTPRWAPWAGGAILLAYLASVIASMTVPANAGDEAFIEDVALTIGFGLFAGLGALMVARRPRHPTGWLYATIGMLVSVGQLGDSLATPWAMRGTTAPLAVTMLAWTNTWYWYLVLLLILVFVPLYFPDGHLPSRRWRVPNALVVAATAVVIVTAGLAERIELQYVDPVTDESLWIVNPIGVRGLGEVEDVAWLDALLVGTFLSGIVMVLVAMIVRFRRSKGAAERQQLKWFFLAATLVATLPVQDLLQIPNVVENVLFAVTLVGLPLSIAIAILRYRLYDIDRIVSRTVTYAVLTAILAGVYGAVVLGAQSVLGPDDAPDVVVAVATLLVAALFGPVRRRVKSVMDRRFDRSRYDATHVVDGFGARLRDQLDTHAVTDALTQSVEATVRPANTWVWLPAPPGDDGR